MAGHTPFPEHSPQIDIRFIDEFDNETQFSSTMSMFTTSDDQVEVFIRFLLACGYSMVSIAKSLESGLNTVRAELALGAEFTEEEIGKDV